jgi:hypothetical protein
VNFNVLLSKCIVHRLVEIKKDFDNMKTRGTTMKITFFYFNDYRSKPTISRHRNITKISTFVIIINSLNSIQ